MIRAMLIDDEVWVIKGLLKKIKWSDFFIDIVATATDGIEAYNLAMELKPDLIITDIRMPGIDGLELIEKLNQSLSDSLSIILSGYDDFVYTQKALRIGAFDYILKPVDISEFESILLRAVKKMKDKHEDKQSIDKIEEIIEENVSSSKIRSIIDFIEENYENDINLNGIAGKFDINPSYLSTVFKKHTGKNFSDYIAEIKINKAKQLLLYTDYKVNAICEKLGFTDYRQFVRTFKRIVGKTPLEYKRQESEK